ncbi:hypothetical protein, partial [Paramuribaculum intestinale]
MSGYNFDFQQRFDFVRKMYAKKQSENFGGSEIMPTFASQSGKRLHRLAKIAQLVEHDLAKVGVA